MLLQTLEQTLRRLLSGQTGLQWVVAVSGGPDSMALLHALLELHNRLGISLHVATFDHQLRGADGAQDVTFVRQIGAAWGVPVTAGSADVGATAADQRLSVEAAARQARYDFLERVARQVGATVVATAHTADDQAETVLMHILRGAGLAGLRGMQVAAPLPGAPDLTLVRPLLDVTRAEVEAYCDEHALNPRFDATNGLPVYLRNRLRLQIMPLLRQINPQVARQLRQLADTSAVDADYIEEAFTAELKSVATVNADFVTLPLDRFRAAHPALQRRFVVWAARQLVPQLEVSYVQQVEAAAVAISGQVGARATLSVGLQLRVDYDAIAIERAGHVADVGGWLMPPDAEIPLAVPGHTRIANWAVDAALGQTTGAKATLAIPEGASVLLRTRRPGDRFAPLGLGEHTQKLKVWLINRKVPQRLRDRLPLLVVDGEIAAIVWGERWPVSEHFALRADSRRIVSFKSRAYDTFNDH